jgi:hypothetical protein
MQILRIVKRLQKIKISIQDKKITTNAIKKRIKSVFLSFSDEDNDIKISNGPIASQAL